MAGAADRRSLAHAAQGLSDTPASPAGVAAAADPLAAATEHLRAGRFAEAAPFIAAFLQTHPDDPEGLHLSGIIAFEDGRIAEAASLIERATAAMPGNAAYHRNLCKVYRAAIRYDDALSAMQRAMALAPDDALGFSALSQVHAERLELDAAFACAERALALDPGCAEAQFDRAKVLLLRGDLLPGWDAYEARFRLVANLVPPTEAPHWDGTPFADRRLLLIADQGFGDAIQFSRYLPWVAERCPDIALFCAPEMVPLLRQRSEIGFLFDDWEKRPAHAAFCPLSGLPRLHRTTLSTIPAPIPYFRPDPEKQARWEARLATLLPRRYRRVGLAWAGRPSHVNDRNRSTTLASLAPLAACRGAALVTLQKGPAQAETGGYFGRAPLVNLGPELADFAETMAAIACLDLVVTVDTALAHLAGAMGKPVWIMLPYLPDWRWLLDRADSPWYPTARLFRPSAPRAWSEVASRIADELQRLPVR
jgi:tetratricopeptide (TPR) repeat protein